ncbi:Sel1 repeat-containing protein [Roseinatronobacter monicus]|uniref:Sel1 repeat-containing protein n=1 Tax=Roseinatronobacter monicus TaxID=393481 RepID=A0A543KCA4_9RHOB|nr:Sel1 repeat-containing protein [Roseinatronobacter monicus]
MREILVAFRIILLFFIIGLPLSAQAQLRAQDGLAALDAGDTKAARAIWTPLAERGDVLAQYNLAVLLATDAGDQADLEQAQHWFEAAAQQTHLGAQLALADMSAEQDDWQSAKYWYEAAAKAGAVRAQFALGKILERGLGTAPDPQQAIRWYQAAADQGHRAAQFALGAALAEQGQDDAAADWFEAAADQGHVEARHNLALALARGLGPQDGMVAALPREASKCQHEWCIRHRNGEGRRDV